MKEKVIVFPQYNNEEVPIRLYDENIEEVIINYIRGAKKEICIAMAWFTSDILMNELKAVKKKGVNIKLIISNDQYNNKNKLEAVCSKLKAVVIPKRKNVTWNNLMHNKYCIIDNKKVIDGSYNWSKNAKYNLEHIIVIESMKVSNMYKNSFEKIYNNPEYYVEYNIYSELA
ncbi:MAG: phospholipase D-like domain-containing protein [Clostridium sp.]|uniref:phospholipase D-like domain-containing protein n=1 Tax=Clostridium sp. TaxID=1506 RepID=UPI002FC603F5